MNNPLSATDPTGSSKKARTRPLPNKEDG
jgi:hypothetical protein